MTDTVSSSTLATLLDPHSSAERLIAAGMSKTEAAAKGGLFAKSAKALIENGSRTDAQAVAIFVPGRIEVLGKHTDYCGGRSLLCTVERGMCFVAVANQDPSIRFIAIDLNEAAEMALDRDLEPAKRHWSNYPMTVARRVARNFPDAVLGANIAMSSDLPAASGLSSSSAMIIGCFMALSSVNHLPTSELYQRNIHHLEDLAGYLGCIENGQSFGELDGDKGVGTFGGSQDHTAILCCKPGKLSLYSFCPIVHIRDIELVNDVQFIIAPSGVIAEKTGDALEHYNMVSKRARQLVSIWNQSRGTHATCLREVTRSTPTAPDDLQMLIATDLESDLKTHELLLARLNQFLIESEKIIPESADAFAGGDWAALRALINKSQFHSEHDLHNQIAETVDLQKELMRSGAIAASAFGAGFGGSVWGLFKKGVLVKNFPSAFVTRPGCAAMAITT